QIKIRFCDTVIDWESDALFSANDVYEQILIIFKTPPYHNINMNNRTTVHVRLYRPTDGEYSPPVEFVYLPLDHGMPAKRAKRAIIHESSDPTTQMPGQWHFASSPHAWNTGHTYPMAPDQHQYYQGDRYQCKMEPSLYDHGSLSSRKRQMTSLYS
uniref:Rel homology dimerisation domain-containing protein n=1 Tax=Romanomermis culicivorax TaxID=13658 RepID=A0A915K2Z7_ROMCU